LFSKGKRKEPKPVAETRNALDGPIVNVVVAENGLGLVVHANVGCRAVVDFVVDEEPFAPVRHALGIH
jgi:hypothetical protein